MGNNQAYSAFQHAVITVYNHGVLTLALLDDLAAEYKGTDIDSGGDTELTTNDGRDLEAICIALVFPDYDPGPEPDEEDESDEPQDYFERRYEKWHEITHDRWKWS